MEDRHLALLEQLVGHVAGLRRDFVQMQETMNAMRADLNEVKQRVERVEGEVLALRTEMKEMRTELSRLVTGIIEDQAALRTYMENDAERRVMVLGMRLHEQYHDRYATLERRIAELEEADRRRREGTSA